MTTTQEDAGPELDPVIHPAHRLRICAALVDATEVEFATLREVVGVSDSVLSKQLTALAAAGYVEQRRAARAGRQRVWVRLTGVGRAAFTAHVVALRAIVGG